ncbi:PQQ-dependent sugar dehydrogenase [Pseudoroseicyclus sp. CXY001]|uniref:PQQ-dependent sugar dehydrogenase n=1 Tax=Pseudoroseicyclus sp. CXY001 TaxID=3242492 RepID=UPI003570F383
MRQLLIPALLAATAAGPALAQVEQGPANADFAPAFDNQTRAPALEPTAVTVETFATGLSHPWGIAPLPEGGWLVTERPGRLRVVGADGSLGEPIAGLPEVDARRQGGLLDVAVGPDFAEDRRIYWTYAKRVSGGTVTAAARGILSEDLTEVTAVEEIFEQTPPSSNPAHYGSRIVFDGPYLYLTTGEHFSLSDRQRAQELGATYGKVVRLTHDGGVPADNPFVETDGARPEVWTLGHRNVQGADLDASGRLWTIEHGPAGGDELNAPEPGLNYGWPVVSYGQNYNGSAVGSGEARAEGFEEPVYYWDPVIAPSGMSFYDGSFAGWQGDLLIGSLTPGGVTRLRIDGGRVTGEERIRPDLGRIRDVEIAPDGSILLLVDENNGAILRMTPGT